MIKRSSKIHLKNQNFKILKKYPLYSVLSILPLFAAGWVIFTTINHPQEASIVQKSTNDHTQQKEQLTNTNGINEIAQPSAVSTSTSPKPAYHSIDAEKERRKNDTSWMEPLSIRLIDNGGGYYCGWVWNGEGMPLKQEVTIYLQRAYIWTNSHRGGTIQWQIEERQNGAITTLYKSSGTVANMQGVYETPSLYDYKIQVTNPDSAIRLKVTAPNTIASNWYTATVPDCYKIS